MQIDWAAVDWVQVGLLGVFAFLASLVGNLLSFKSRFWGAVMTAVLFAALYIFWLHYPHGFKLPAPMPKG
jgi:hypothetical protein